MATLHVRNVPDELYEALRARAETAGESISATAVLILGEALSQRGGALFGRRRRRKTQPFERFTPIARTVVVNAQAEARALSHAYIGTEHLLLALSGEGAAGRALAHLGLSADAVRARIVEMIGRGEGTPAGPIPFTPRAKKVFELGLRESLSRGYDHVGTEQILLGIAIEGEGVAARILAGAGADLNAVRAAVVMALTQGPDAPAPGPVTEPGFRVVELAGSPGEWEHALNQAASHGWELVSIISDAGAPRAVFRSE